MLDYLLEQPTDLESTWDKAWLRVKFEEEVVGPKVKDPEVIEEMKAGVPVDDVLDGIWLGFEEWADAYLNNEQQAFYEV